MPAKFKNATVFNVDDDQQARESVCALVRSMGLAARAFASAEDFLDAYRDEPGCVVTDLRMLGMNGLELQSTMNERGMSIPIIIITAYASTPLTVRAMKQGAISLLEKPYEDNELWDSILEALQKDDERRTQFRRQQEIYQQLESLTDKERETMELVVQGKPNKVIARILGVSVRTVESRRHNIFQKTEVESLAELVQKYLSVEQQAQN